MTQMIGFPPGYGVIMFVYMWSGGEPPLAPELMIFGASEQHCKKLFERHFQRPLDAVLKEGLYTIGWGRA